MQITLLQGENTLSIDFDTPLHLSEANATVYSLAVDSFEGKITTPTLIFSVKKSPLDNLSNAGGWSGLLSNRVVQGGLVVVGVIVGLRFIK